MSNLFKSSLDFITGFGDGPVAVADPPVVEPAAAAPIAEPGAEPVVEPVVEPEGAPAVDEDITLISDGEPVTDPAVVDHQKIIAGKDAEIAGKDAEIAAMRLVAERAAAGIPAPTGDEPVVEEFADVVGSFISDPADFETAMGSAAGMNVLLNKVFNAGRKETFDRSQAIREVVGGLDSRITRSQLIDAFYRANEDLHPYRNFVGVVAAEMQTKKDYGNDYSELFTSVAKEVRTRLNLNAPAPVVVDVGQPVALVAGQGGARQTIPQLGEQEGMLNNMLEDNE